MRGPETTFPVLLFDGSCGFCSAIVQFVLKRDRQQTLRFASLDSDFAKQVRRTFPQVERVDSVVWLDSGARHVAIRSDAIRLLGVYLGGPWRIIAVMALIPRPLRDWAYDRIARHRKLLSAPNATCLVPDPALRHRFL